MDAGKAISAMLPQQGSVTDYLEGMETARHDGRKTPFVATSFAGPVDVVEQAETMQAAANAIAASSRFIDACLGRFNGAQ